MSYINITVPDKCDDCKWIGRYEKGLYARHPHCCCELIYKLQDEDYKVNKNTIDKNCPLKAMAKVFNKGEILHE